MRSSAQASEDLLARLFTDAELRARFKAGSARQSAASSVSTTRPWQRLSEQIG